MQSQRKRKHSIEGHDFSAAKQGELAGSVSFGPLARAKLSTFRGNPAVNDFVLKLGARWQMVAVSSRVGPSCFDPGMFEQ